jgi:hypothetical protein
MAKKGSLKEFEELITKGLTEVKKKLLKFKKDKDSPLIVTKDGKVVEIDPKKMEEEKATQDKK